MSDAHAIDIQHVTKRFGSHVAVDDLTLAVPKGSLCGFLGPNGAGKSTTIRMIMSIIYPDEGSIDVLGGTALKSKDKIGYLPEERSVYRKMKVGEFLHYMASLKGVPRSWLSQRIDEWLKRVDLPDVRQKKCEELSKGMQQKVQFLAAIIHEPELLILDEPFSGLDPVNAELLQDLIKTQHAQGKTIIFSTHVLHQAEQLCDRIFLINKGRKLLDATLGEIRQRFDPRSILLDPLEDEVDEAGLRAMALPGVMDVRHSGDGSAFELELEEEAHPQQIMQTLINRIPVRDLRLRRLTLDEVFVQVVRRDLGVEAADVAREELSHV